MVFFIQASHHHPAYNKLQLKTWGKYTLTKTDINKITSYPGSDPVGLNPWRLYSYTDTHIGFCLVTCSNKEGIGMSLPSGISSRAPSLPPREAVRLSTIYRRLHSLALMNRNAARNLVRPPPFLTSSGIPWSTLQSLVDLHPPSGDCSGLTVHSFC